MGDNTTFNEALVTLAGLLGDAFGARSVPEFAGALTARLGAVNEWDTRTGKRADELRRDIVKAVRYIGMAEIAPEELLPKEMEPLPADVAIARFERLLLNEAALLDRRQAVGFDGEALRAAIPALVDAARGIARRSAGALEFDAIRDLEAAGAPAAMLFRLDGKLLWFNSALGLTCQRRNVPRDGLIKEGARLARRLAVDSLAMGGSAAHGTEMQRPTEWRLLLKAVLQPSASDLRATHIEISVAEVRRESRLTERELTVARLVCELGSYEEVAKSADVSIDSVRTYVRRVYRKLAVSSRAMLRARMIREGLFNLGPPTE